MKKVKIMLMATLVVAVVGGALAFKAKSPGLFCSSASSACTVKEPLLEYTFAQNGGPSVENKWCTTTTEGVVELCKTVTVEQ